MAESAGSPGATASNSPQQQQPAQPQQQQQTTQTPQPPDISSSQLPSPPITGTGKGVIFVLGLMVWVICSYRVEVREGTKKSGLMLLDGCYYMGHFCVE